MSRRVKKRPVRSSRSAAGPSRPRDRTLAVPRSEHHRSRLPVVIVGSTIPGTKDLKLRRKTLAADRSASTDLRRLGPTLEPDQSGHPCPPAPTPGERVVTTSTPRGPLARPAPTATTGRPGLMLATATIGFAVTFWAWALLSPLGGDAARAAAPERLPAVAGRGGTRDRRLARPYPRRRAHRPVGRTTDVPDRGTADRAAGALPRPPRELTHRLPHRRLLPRPRRHDVRDRHPVRELVVSRPPVADWPSGSSGPVWAAPPSRRSPPCSSARPSDPASRSTSSPPSSSSTRSLAHLLLRDRPDRQIVPGGMLARLATTLRMRRHPGSCRSCTPWPSAGSSRSACTSPPTWSAPSTSTAATPHCARPGSSCSPW